MLKRWKEVLLFRVLKQQAGGPATRLDAAAQEHPTALHESAPYLAALRHELPPTVVLKPVPAHAAWAAASGCVPPEVVQGIKEGRPPPSLGMGAGPAPGTVVFGAPLGTVEVPGQYATCPGMPHPEAHAKLLAVEPEVRVLYRQQAFQRRLGLRGNDGRVYYFTVQTAAPYQTRSDERMMQLHWLMARLLEQNHLAQRRSLAVHVPVVVPLTPRLRLLEDDAHFTSLGEVYEAERHARGLDPDAPILLCRERCSQAIARARLEVRKGLGFGWGCGALWGGDWGSGLCGVWRADTTRHDTAQHEHTGPQGAGGGAAEAKGAGGAGGPARARRAQPAPAAVRSAEGVRRSREAREGGRLPGRFSEGCGGAGLVLGRGVWGWMGG